MIANLINFVIQSASFEISPSWYLFSAFLLAVLPVAIGLLTSYVKISVVLGIIKNALGTQHAPSTMVTLSLSLALSALVMTPIIKESLQISKTIDSNLLSSTSTLKLLESLTPLAKPWLEFLQKNTGKREILVLQNSLAKTTDLEQKDAEVSREFEAGYQHLALLIPAFLLTELKEGFAMGFIILLPFLAIDLIVANILMGLGMMMVSPVMISLPLKLVLFVASDSWLLITQAILDLIIVEQTMLTAISIQTLKMVLIISSIPLVVSSISGLIVSIVQAATSIQEQSISYLVKIVSLSLTLYFCSTWFYSEFIELIQHNISAIAYLGR